MPANSSSIVISFYQLEQLREATKINRDAFAATQRAWLAPTNALFDRPVKSGEQVSIGIVYDNVGREPALNVTHGEEVHWVNSPKVSNVSPEFWANQLLGANATCDHPTESDRIVAYPSSHSSYRTHVLIKSDSFADELLWREKTLYIQGCIAYETVGAERHSAYCIYFEPDAAKPPEQWQFRFCADGNFAD